MSKFVDEIIKDIEDNPNSWSNLGHGCIFKNNIVISGQGNSRLLSVIDVYIDKKEVRTTYTDKWNLESAVMKYYKIVDLKTLTS